MHIELVCMLSSNAVLLLFLVCLSLRSTTEKREWRGEKILLRVVSFISFRFSPIFAIVKILWDWFKGQHETNTVASSVIDKDPADEGTRALGLMQHATAICSFFVVQIIRVVVFVVRKSGFLLFFVSNSFTWPHHQWYFFFFSCFARGIFQACLPSFYASSFSTF